MSLYHRDLSFATVSCAPTRDDEPSLRDQVLDALEHAGYRRFLCRTLDVDTCIVALHQGPALRERASMIASLLQTAGYDCLVLPDADGVLMVGWRGTLGAADEVADPYALVVQGTVVEEGRVAA